MIKILGKFIALQKNSLNFIFITDKYRTGCCYINTTGCNDKKPQTNYIAGPGMNQLNNKRMVVKRREPWSRNLCPTCRWWYIRHHAWRMIPWQTGQASSDQAVDQLELLTWCSMHKVEKPTNYLEILNIDKWNEIFVYKTDSSIHLIIAKHFNNIANQQIKEKKWIIHMKYCKGAKKKQSLL